MGVKDDAAVAAQKRDQITEENCDAGLDDPHADRREYACQFTALRPFGCGIAESIWIGLKWEIGLCRFDATVLIHGLFLPVVLLFVIEQGEFHLLAVPGARCCQTANFHTRLCT
jgi:hypothetical protein